MTAAHAGAVVLQCGPGFKPGGTSSSRTQRSENDCFNAAPASNPGVRPPTAGRISHNYASMRPRLQTRGYTEEGLGGMGTNDCFNAAPASNPGVLASNGYSTSDHHDRLQCGPGFKPGGTWPSPTT